MLTAFTPDELLDFWRGRATALRVLYEQSHGNETIARVEVYEECAGELAQALTAEAGLVERLLDALAECAAPYFSPPTTVMGGAAHVAREFQRRMQLAADAIAEHELLKYQISILSAAVCEAPEKSTETLLDAAFANCKPHEGFDGPQGAN